MAITVRLKRSDNVLLDTSVESLDISKKLSQSAEWSFSIPRNTVEELSVISGDFVEIFSDGVLLVEGYIQKITLSNSDVSKYNVSGRDLVDNLFLLNGDANASYEDETVISIFAKLLWERGWRLGNIDTFEGIEDSITIDLRSNETIFAQIKKIIEQFSGISFRYGGIYGGYPRIDIGTFGTKQNIYVTNTPNRGLVANEQNVIGIESIDQSQELEITTKIESFGGDVNESGVKRRITLRDAVEGDSQWLEGYDGYRIVESVVNREYYMVNGEQHPPGGRIDTNELDNTITYPFGGFSTSNVLYHAGISIIGVEGYLESIDTRLYRAVPDTRTFAISIYEYDPGDPNNPYSTPVLATSESVQASELTPFGVGSRVRLVIPAEDRFYFEGDKRYWVVFHDPNAVATSNQWWAIYGESGVNNSVSVTYAYSTNNGVSWIAGTSSADIVFNFTPEDSKGRLAITKTFSEYSPPDQNSDATALSIQGAGLALANRSKAYLQDRSDVFLEASVKGNGISDFPIVGNQVYLNFTRRSGLYDANNATYRVVNDAIQQWLKCISVSAKYSDKGLSWDLELTNSPAITQEQYAIEIYKASRDDNKEASAGIPTPLANTEPTLYTIASNVSSGTPANDVYDGLPVYKLTIPLPARPDTVTNLYCNFVADPVVSNPSNDTIRGIVTQDFDFWNGQDAEIVFTSVNGWNASMSTDYTFYYTWA